MDSSTDAYFFTVDSLCVFPPKSVKLKNPFAIQPWIKSEENVGNLLMVCAHYHFYLFSTFNILENTHKVPYIFGIRFFQS